MIALLDAVLLGNMCERCVHDCLCDCLRGGTLILLLFPTHLCGGFHFQFFRSKKDQDGPLFM
jgi:hypothetical protein